MGEGIIGGQAIGCTDAEAVDDHPVGTLDFLATVCRILGIDHNKEKSPVAGRSASWAWQPNQSTS